MSQIKDTDAWYIGSKFQMGGFYTIQINQHNGNLLAIVNGESKEAVLSSANLIVSSHKLLASLKELVFSAECRENTIGDLCHLLECKDNLRKALREAKEVIAKVLGE
jgi:hypothetical protein